MENKSLQITNHDFLIYKDSNNDVKVSVMLINKVIIVENKEKSSPSTSINWEMEE